MLNRKDLEEYIGLVGLAEKKKSTEVKLPVVNARRIADGLAFLLLELEETRKALENAEQKLQDTAIVSVELDGGSFR